MGGQHRDGENLLGRVIEGAAIGTAAAIVHNGLREAYQQGFQNPPRGIPAEGYGQNSLPRIEIDRMHEDSRHAANELIRSGGRDQGLAQMELQHAALVDKTYDQQGRYYQEALRELSRDVREQSRNEERLSVGTGYNGRPDLRIEANNAPLYRQPEPHPGNYYHSGNVYVPRGEFKK